MTSRRLLTRIWWVGLFLVVCLSLPALAQQAPTSDIEVARQGALALAAAHGEKPRYGGKFLSAGNEEIPFYDLHQTFPSVMPGRANNGAPKTYFLNSETAFLEQVRYRLTRAGRTTEVFVRISNWQRFGGEWMPTVIERFENGSPVVTLSVNAVAFSPKTNDGLFDRR